MVEEDRASQRLVEVDISPITSDHLKFGLGRIGRMFEREVVEVFGLDIEDPERRLSEAKAVVFGQVMAAIIVALERSEYKEEGSGPSVIASAAMERMVEWYRDSAREARTTNIIPDIGEEIVLARAVAFAKSLSAIGQERVVGQIDAQLREEGGVAGR